MTKKSQSLAMTIAKQGTTRHHTSQTGRRSWNGSRGRASLGGRMTSSRLFRMATTEMHQRIHQIRTLHFHLRPHADGTIESHYGSDFQTYARHSLEALVEAFDNPGEGHRELPRLGRKWITATGLPKSTWPRSCFLRDSLRMNFKPRIRRTSATR